MQAGDGQVPWRKPNLRKVGRQGSSTRRPSSEIPVWAEEAKKRLGDVPVTAQKPEQPRTKPKWSERRVDVDKLDEVERRHQEKAGQGAVSQPPPQWTPKKMDATTLGRLERANRLDKMASIDKQPSEWADKMKPLDFSKIQQLEARCLPDPPCESKLAAPLREVKLKPLPPPPPPPPPPPLRAPPLPPLPDKTPLNEKQRCLLESLKKTPRRRPDWNELLHELHDPGRNLRKVQCNDRSAPIVKDVQRRDSAFVFESEKDTTDSAAKLLTEIHGGRKLKKVKCNDRSKPNLEGLRKLRRQKTSEAFLNLPPEELIDSEPEELDDIDKLRDDLQSTRQLLGDEVKNCERLAKENKHLKNETHRLQEQLERMKTQTFTPRTEVDGSTRKREEAAIDDDLGDLEEEMVDLRAQADASNEAAKGWELRSKAAEEDLAALKAKLLEYESGSKPSIVRSVVENGGVDADLVRNKSSAKVAKSKTKDKLNKQQPKVLKEQVEKTDASKSTNAPGKLPEDNSQNNRKEQKVKDAQVSSSEDSSDEETDSEEERRRELDEDRKKRMRDLKMCKSRISHINTKEKHAKEERIGLKNRIKALNANIKDENRKYRELQKEVRKMGAMLKGSDEEDDDESEEDSEDESSEEESEESSSGTDEESSDESESDDESLPAEDRLKNMQQSAKRHEDNEKAVKKGNYMLKTTAERLFDRLRNEKEKYRILERELNDLVNELT